MRAHGMRARRPGAPRLPALRLAWLVAVVFAAGLLSGLCYVAGALVPLALAVAAGYLGLCLAAPGWAVVVGCLLVPFEAVQLPVGALGSLSPAEGAFVLCGATWVLRAAAGARTALPSLADFPIWLLIAAFVPGLSSGVPLGVVLKYVVTWTCFYLVFLTVRTLTPRESLRVLLALVAGAATMGGLGVVNYLVSGGASLSESGAMVSGRAATAIPDPNYYGAYLLLAATPALALVVGRHLRATVAVPVAVGCALAAAGIVVSLSRGAILGFALAVGLIVMAWRRSRAVSAVAVVALGITLVANVGPVANSSVTELVATRLSSITTHTEENKRTLIWSAAVDVVHEHPAFGVGALNWPAEATARGITQGGEPLSNVHNTYLNLAAELGLLGLVAFLLWLIRIGRDLAIEVRRQRGISYAVTIGVAAAMAGYALQGLTVSQYLVQVIQADFFILAAIAASVRYWPDEPDTTELESGRGRSTGGSEAGRSLRLSTSSAAASSSRV